MTRDRKYRELFNPRREHDKRRLCRDCAKAAGWQR